MKGVINEALRLFPPVPLNVRECRSTPCIFPQSDRTYPNTSNQPLYMPPTTTIVILPLLMQRNPALWGDDADDFNPERWIDPERVKKFVANPTMFAPFSAGPRIVSVIFLSLSLFFFVHHSSLCFENTVLRAELCIQRDVLFPRASASTLWQIHARFGGSAFRVTTSTWMEVSQRSTSHGKNMAQCCYDPFCEGWIMGTIP